MGVKLKFAALFIVFIVVVIGLVVFLNITFFCQLKNQFYAPRQCAITCGCNI